MTILMIEAVWLTSTVLCFFGLLERWRRPQYAWSRAMDKTRVVRAVSGTDVDIGDLAMMLVTSLIPAVNLALGAIMWMHVMVWLHRRRLYETSFTRSAKRPPTRVWRAVVLQRRER